MNYFFEPYAESINLILPVLLFLGCLCYLFFRLHLIMLVTPRIDRINGYRTTHRFKINLHQSAVYQRYFSNADLNKKALFKVGEADRWLFQCDKYIARAILILIPLSFSFLSYTYTLVI